MRHSAVVVRLAVAPDCSLSAAVPRWASTNLGVFICTNCSVRSAASAARAGWLQAVTHVTSQGIHRGLGVHISKVRSCALDKWTPELLTTMENIGNKRANEHWEHDVPASVARPREGDMRCATGARARLSRGGADQRGTERLTAGFATSTSWVSMHRGAPVAL